MSAATGARLWSSSPFASNSTLACAAVDGDSVYVASRDRLAVYDAKDGSSRWSHTEPGFWPSSPPAVAAGGVYLSGAGGSGAEYGQHLALDADTGARRWLIDGSQTERPPLLTGAAVLQTRRSAAGLSAYSPATGQTLWSDPSAYGYGRIADGNTVFYTKPGPDYTTTLVARHATTGAVLWQWAVPEGQYAGSMVADDARLYVRMSFNDGNLRGRVVALDRSSGAVVWNKPSANITDHRLMRLGRSLLSLGYSGGAAFSPETGTSAPLGDGFSRVGGANNAAYADSTFYVWNRNYDAGTYTLEAWRDVVAPQLTLSAPSDDVTTSDPRPSFAWSVSDGAGVGVADVTLRLDGRAPIALGATSGSYRSEPLADGTYQFTVRASDGVGNATTTSAQRLTVDTQMPNAAATHFPTTGDTVSVARPKFEWARAEDATSGVARYELSVDGRAIGTLASTACAADACQLQPTGAISDGAHSWSVAAVDRAGNSRTSEGGHFTVAAPPAGSLSATAAIAYADSDIRLRAAFSDPNDASISYRWDLDGDGSFEYASGQDPVATARFSNAATHTVRAQASDPGGLTTIAATTVETRHRPPAGELGVSINDGAIATNNPNVQLTVVWPSFATDALIANDGGFGSAGSASLFPVAQSIPWRLASSWPERLPKTVYLRFKGGSAGRESYTDDIILDERPPRLLSASTGERPATASAAAVKVASRSFFVRGKDENSGISAVQVSARRDGRGATTKQLVRRSKRGKRTYAARVRMRAPSGKVWVRVRDAAGNSSAWRRAG